MKIHANPRRKKRRSGGTWHRGLHASIAIGLRPVTFGKKYNDQELMEFIRQTIRADIDQWATALFLKMTRNERRKRCQKGS